MASYGQSAGRTECGAGMTLADGSRRYRVHLVPEDDSGRGAQPSIRPGGTHPLYPAEKAIVQRSAFAVVPGPVCKAARRYRSNIRCKQLCHIDDIGKTLATLQTLRHARQQIADCPVCISLFLQSLTRQTVLAKYPDRLCHVAYFIYLVKTGRLNGIILRCETVYDIAQTHDGAQDATL